MKQTKQKNVAQVFDKINVKLTYLNVKILLKKSEFSNPFIQNTINTILIQLKSKV